MNTSKFSHCPVIGQATTTSVLFKGVHYIFNQLSLEEKKKLKQDMEKAYLHQIESAIPNAKKILAQTEAKAKDLSFSLQCLSDTMSELDMNQKVVLYNHLNPIIKLDVELHIAIQCMQKDENWIIEDEQLNELVVEKFLNTVTEEDFKELFDK